LIALIRKRDKFHPAALEAAELYSGPFLTTDLIKDKCRQKAKKKYYTDRKQAEIVKSVALTPLAQTPLTHIIYVTGKGRQANCLVISAIQL